VTKKPNSTFFGNFLYVLGSQVIVLISGFIKALVVPVLLGLSDYGYWQIYIFYTLYIGVFTFGYGDGLYLKYGGFKFDDLPLCSIRTANALYAAMLAVGAAALVGFAHSNPEPQRQIVFFAVAANVVVLGINSNISLTLQATNQLKGYAVLNSADKIFFILALLALFQEDFRTFEYLIAVDLGAKLMVMAMLLQKYHKLFIGPLVKLTDGVKEFAGSLSAGIQLLLANLSGMLVLGVGRIIIEYFGALDSYAYYAFAASLASVVLVSVTSLSIVIYPTLRRQPKDNYIGYFDKTNSAYFAFILLMLTAYFPAVAFIDLAASEYGPVIDFLNAIFTITVLEGKMQLVNNTYYKALRLERAMLVANMTSLLVATVLSVVGFMLTQSILAIAYAALVTMLFRVYASEIFLRRYMGGAPDRGLLTEVLVLGIFLLVTLVLPLALAGGAWLALVVTMAILKRGELGILWHQLRSSAR
jgi:O-antigen/teichoic acid export membrane protein